MILNMSKPGYSFTGAAEYYDHDKGRKKSRYRVAWTTTRNLMAHKPEVVVKIMIATALDADRLKQRAGVKATGRKSAKHVQTLSLSWHPSEKVTRAEMEAAADEVIELLGLQDHQIAMWAHNDTDHDHLHLLANRVHPWTGVMATLSNAHRKLDRWAHEYEKRRDNIVSLNRHEKYKRMEAIKTIHPDATERNAYAKKKRAEAAKDKPLPRSKRWEALQAAETARKAREQDRAAQREQEEAEAAQRALERANKEQAERDKREADRQAREQAERDKREADRQARLDQLLSEEKDVRSEALRKLFTPYTLEDSTFDPSGEWLRALALRVLDDGQRELRQIFEVDFNLDEKDPIAFRKKFAKLDATQQMQLTTAVDDLDRKMDADPTRNWKQRRLAFTEMVDAHRDNSLLPDHTRQSPIQIFKTVIKRICERSGLKAFYDNVLVPLVSSVAEVLRPKPPLPSPKQNPDPMNESKASGFDYS